MKSGKRSGIELGRNISLRLEPQGIHMGLLKLVPNEDGEEGDYFLRITEK